MHWKMSIDLSYVLVPSMGQHDPLDGLVTYCELQARQINPKSNEIGRHSVLKVPRWPEYAKDNG